MLRDSGDPDEEKRQVGWRIRASLASYIEERAAGKKRGAETRIVEEALSLHKALYEGLKTMRHNVAQYAIDEGLVALDPSDQERIMILRLVQQGLAQHGKQKK